MKVKDNVYFSWSRHGLNFKLRTGLLQNCIGLYLLVRLGSSNGIWHLLVRSEYMKASFFQCYRVIHVCVPPNALVWYCPDGV